MTKSYNPAFKGFYDEHVIHFHRECTRYTRTYTPGLRGIVTTHWLMKDGREYVA